MTIINTNATRAAAIGVAARRVEITRNERDHHLRLVNEKAAELAGLQDKLDKSEAELRVEEFILDSLIAEATRITAEILSTHTQINATDGDN